ncbi:SOS response-associated peptidase [Halomonas garicola]|uniref:SOS response-associated peptidase n=1 Tax=Halomonas garicola TaxID=1690008 RepID=UPI0028A24911|nr:SOS response-associated peptidase [Halomonas garicola]
MCGRFALYSDVSTLARSLGMPLAEPELAPRYNVPPGTWIRSVRRGDDDAPCLDALWWGYRPGWADEKAPQPINATAEKVATSAYFRDAFAHRRCLVPANGWFEWLNVDGRKQPHYLTREDGEPLWMAGLWAERPDGRLGCAIITEPARGAAAAVHPRMPLVLDQPSLEPWLDAELTQRDAIRRRVRHLTPEALIHWPVSARVNKPVEDDAGLIEPEG